MHTELCTTFAVCRPIPDREFVETYVKAFYLTENEMERWIREHKVCVFCFSFDLYDRDEFSVGFR